jgi:predicted FMN-binding regulatory protein PaiB
MSQNRNQEDLQRIITDLEKGNQRDQELARRMKRLVK